LLCVNVMVSVGVVFYLQYVMVNIMWALAGFVYIKTTKELQSDKGSRSHRASRSIAIVAAGWGWVRARCRVSLCHMPRSVLVIWHRAVVVSCSCVCVVEGQPGACALRGPFRFGLLVGLSNRGARLPLECAEFCGEKLKFDFGTCNLSSQCRKQRCLPSVDGVQFTWWAFTIITSGRGWAYIGVDTAACTGWGFQARFPFQHTSAV
jgi:hypothetical protein